MRREVSKYKTAFHMYFCNIMLHKSEAGPGGLGLRRGRSGKAEQGLQAQGAEAGAGFGLTATETAGKQESKVNPTDKRTCFSVNIFSL